MKEEYLTEIDFKKDDKTYYVGIGASAGGLEALQELFKAMPEDSGMVFVVVQHLSPDYKSLMDELLSRYTKMDIYIATDGMETQPNKVYLIPPKKNLSIFHGRLFLEDQEPNKGLNLPIDIFFRSLAKDKEKNAIGIVLSGTGTDGTLGIKAIKESGGMVMVQTEESAKFDGMPKSSISTGIVDYLLAPSKMPEELLNYIKHPFVSKTRALEKVMSKNVDTLTKIILMLREFTGIDFSYYKKNTIIRRLERRVSINRFNTLEEYIRFFTESEKEKETLYRELLIGVTRFFRDEEAFDALLKKVLVKWSTDKRSIRIWSAGCSTGEEVYSLAILIKEHLCKNNVECDVKIFATDIDRHSLEIAGQGLYPESIVADVDPVLISKYFVRKENGYQVVEDIRKMIVFATHNLLKDPPFSKLDLLVCRNLFIYLKPEIQQKLLHMFYHSLKLDGYLFMGSSESIGEMSEAFKPLDTKWKIYSCKKGYKPPVIRDLVAQRTVSNENSHIAMGQSIFSGIKMDKLLESALSKVIPPSIILDSNQNIVHVVNDVNRFLSIKPGRFSQSIVNNISSNLSLFVNNMLRRLKSEKNEIIFENITGIDGFDGEIIDISGRKFEIEKKLFYMLTFDVKNKRKKKTAKTSSVDIEIEVNDRVNALEREVQVTRETLQATVEELETSNEELQSSNEELIASNEELQSTNEELQSVNEELYTVNSEYQLKIDELTRSNNDLDNLLKNTDVGALYLDRTLCIRKITPLVSSITNILPSDIGRPISHISVINECSDLLSDINYVVETLKVLDRSIKDEKGNLWLARIRPYRTEYNAVEGVILTFIDIARRD